MDPKLVFRKLVPGLIGLKKTGFHDFGPRTSIPKLGLGLKACSGLKSFENSWVWTPNIENENTKHGVMRPQKI